jgi:hypothetical protein
MRNSVRAELCFDALKRLQVRDSNRDDVRDSFFRTQLHQLVNGVIGLNDLLREGKIGADENVNVWLVDLCHGERNMRLVRFVRQAIFWPHLNLGVIVPERIREVPFPFVA